MSEEEKTPEPSSGDPQSPPKPIEELLHAGDSKLRASEKYLQFDDDPSEMTLSRRCAKYLSATTSWYNPSAKKENGPDLDLSWAYFEHITLPRHFVPGREYPEGEEKIPFFARHKNRVHKAENGLQGEKTLLYSVWGTSEADLVDFGLGVAIYFWTLRMLVILMFLAGLISIPNMIYFSSSSYSLNQQSGSGWALRGSAVCTDTQWVACPNCTLSDWQGRIASTTNRFASTMVNGQELRFIVKNNCRITFSEGVVSLVVLLFVVVFLWGIGEVSKNREVRFDESNQTATDYSIEVQDPPLDANDPDEWKAFFEQFGGHATLVTIALDNEELIRALLQRRKLMRQIENTLQPGVKWDPKNLDEMAKQCMPVPGWKKRLLFAKTGEELLKKIRESEEEARTLSKKEIAVSNVFVTMETEKAQRTALEALGRPYVELWRGAPNMPTRHKFRGKHILSTREPAEPSTILWQDLDVTFRTKMIQAAVSYTITFLFIIAGVILIAQARLRSPLAAALTIKVISIVTPLVATQINNRLETRSTEGARQASLYIKMTLIKWVHSAITTTIILPFDDTVEQSAGLIHTVYAIFITEMITSPVIGMSDVVGNFKKHFLGPRAPDQKRMNLDFRGAFYEMSERYTDMTKVVFLTLFYADIFPAGFFFAAVTLFIHYWTDKFRLFRTWRPGPEIGSEIAEFSRVYFFSACLVAYAIMQAYRFAGYPFDNTCIDGTRVSQEYVGTFNATTGNGMNITATIAENDLNVFFCSQDMLRYRNPRVYPPLSRNQRFGNWMTSDQANVSGLLGWASVGVLAFVILVYFRGFLYSVVRVLFIDSYQASGKEGGQDFSEVKDINGYVPQVDDPLFNYPVLAADVDDFPSSFISWNDPAIPHPHPVHCLIDDLPDLDEYNESVSPIFSTVKYYEPPPKG